MEAIKLTGVIRSISEVTEKGNFKFKTAIIDVDGHTKYPNVFSVQFSGERIPLLDTVTQGYNVTFHCNLKGREYTNPNTGVSSVFTSIDCFKIDISYTAGN